MRNDGHTTHNNHENNILCSFTYDMPRSTHGNSKVFPAIIIILLLLLWMQLKFNGTSFEAYSKFSLLFFYCPFCLHLFLYFWLLIVDTNNLVCFIEISLQSKDDSSSLLLLLFNVEHASSNRTIDNKTQHVTYLFKIRLISSYLSISLANKLHFNLFLAKRSVVEKQTKRNASV